MLTGNDSRKLVFRLLCAVVIAKLILDSDLYWVHFGWFIFIADSLFLRTLSQAPSPAGERSLSQQAVMLEDLQS